MDFKVILCQSRATEAERRLSHCPYPCFEILTGQVRFQSHMGEHTLASAGCPVVVVVHAGAGIVGWPCRHLLPSSSARLLRLAWRQILSCHQLNRHENVRSVCFEPARAPTYPQQ